MTSRTRRRRDRPVEPRRGAAPAHASALRRAPTLARRARSGSPPPTRVRRAAPAAARGASPGRARVRRGVLGRPGEREPVAAALALALRGEARARGGGRRGRRGARPRRPAVAGAAHARPGGWRARLGGAWLEASARGRLAWVDGSTPPSAPSSPAVGAPPSSPRRLPLRSGARRPRSRGLGSSRSLVAPGGRRPAGAARRRLRSLARSRRSRLRPAARRAAWPARSPAPAARAARGRAAWPEARRTPRRHCGRAPRAVTALAGQSTALVADARRPVTVTADAARHVGSRGQASVLLVGGLAGLLIAARHRWARSRGRSARRRRRSGPRTSPRVAAARVMHENYGRLFEPALIDGRPNPQHLEKADVPRARAGARRVEVARGQRRAAARR